MKKIVWTFGLISGAICTAWLITFVAMGVEAMNMDYGEVVGYSSMILAFSLIFVGIKQYRDKLNGGAVSFGKAFQIGLYIALIGSTFYVVTWAIEYNFFASNFMEEYTRCMVDKAKASGKTQAEINETLTQMAKYKEWYKNPVFFTLMTYMEILPVGLLVSLLAAAILRKKPKELEILNAKN